MKARVEFFVDDDSKRGVVFDPAGDSYRVEFGEDFFGGVLFYGRMVLTSDDAREDNGPGFGVELGAFSGGENGMMAFRVSGGRCSDGVAGNLGVGNEVTLWPESIGQTIAISDCFGVPGARIQITAIE